MRVLYDHQVFSLQDAGGASRYHFELIRNLQLQEDLEIQILLGLNASVMPFASLQQRRTRVLGRPTGLRPGFSRYAINELWSAVAAPLRGRVDIYHPTLYRALPWVRRHAVVVTHHDCIHERFPHLFPNANSIVAAKRRLFAQADAILCVSSSSQRDLLHFYDVSESKTHVVHHGFTPLNRASGGGKRAKPYLLYVGSRASYKNFGLLLHAFSRSQLASNYRLLAVGGGNFTPQEQQQIASYALADVVTLIPKANEATLAQAYGDAALFVYPSMYEGFGFPPLEAMSTGCPVLVSRTSSLPEICGDAAFYFDPEDAGDLAYQLQSLLNDPHRLASKRHLGEQQVKLYDWGRCAERTLAVYGQATGKILD